MSAGEEQRPVWVGRVRPRATVTRGQPSIAAHLGALGVVALGCAQIVPGCARIAGIDDYEVRADAGAYRLPGTQWIYASRSCGACTARSCQSEVAACRDDPTCDAFIECLALCLPGDAACATRCERAIQGRFFSREANVLLACAFAGCLEECGAVQQGCPTVPAPTERELACCREQNECLADPDCTRLFSCYAACGWDGAPGSLACLTGCGGPDAPTHPGQKAFWECFATRCDESCQGVGDDSCIDSVVVPAPSAGSHTAYFSIIDLVTQAPVPDVTVRACGRLDVDCAFADIQGTTDQDGLVVLPLTRRETYFDASLPGRLPHLFFRPLWWFNHSPAFTARMVPPASPLLAGSDLSQNGAILFSTRGCASGLPEAGLEVAIEPAGATKRHYLVNGAPSATATQTDASGAGVFLDVPPGSVEIRTVRAGTRKPIGREVVYVRPGTVTNVIVSPVAWR